MTTSKARVALDGWLSEAERLLAEQRANSISPSIHPGSWSTGEIQSAKSIREVARDLEGLLARLTAAPGRWILVIEDARITSRYLQCLSYEDGSLVCEVASNHYLRDDHRWTGADSEKLSSLGWRPPKPPDRPNWIGVWPDLSPPVDLVAALSLRTLREVFRLGEDDKVVVRMFSSPNRGGTPASEVVPTEVTKPEAGQV